MHTRQYASACFFCPFRAWEVSFDCITQSHFEILGCNIIVCIFGVGYSEINVGLFTGSVKYQGDITVLIGKHLIHINELFQAVLALIYNPFGDIEETDITGSIKIRAILDFSFNRNIEFLQLGEICFVDLNTTGSKQSLSQFFRCAVIGIRHLRKILVPLALHFLKLFGAKGR